MSSDVHEVVRPACMALMLIVSGLWLWQWQDRTDNSIRPQKVGQFNR